MTPFDDSLWEMAARRANPARDTAAKAALAVVRAALAKAKVPLAKAQDLASDAIAASFEDWSPERDRELTADAVRIALLSSAPVRTREHGDLTKSGDLPRSEIALAEVGRRAASALGRRPKVRKGTERLVFRGTGGDPGFVLHVSGFVSDDGPVNLRGEPVPAAGDWVDAAVRAITGAKLAVVAYLDQIRDVPESHRAGVPDPRGPRLAPGDVLSATAIGVTVQRGNCVEFIGRGEAVPRVILQGMAGSGTPPPSWFSEGLVAWLIERASGGTSGGRGGASSLGAGLLSASTLEKLLRKPTELSKELHRQAAREQKAWETRHRADPDRVDKSDPEHAQLAWVRLHQIASSLPRKRRQRPG